MVIIHKIGKFQFSIVRERIHSISHNQSLLLTFRTLLTHMCAHVHTHIQCIYLFIQQMPENSVHTKHSTVLSNWNVTSNKDSLPPPPCSSYAYMRNKQVTDTACSKLISYRKKCRQKKKNKGMGSDKECLLGTGYEQTHQRLGTETPQVRKNLLSPLPGPGFIPLHLSSLHWDTYTSTKNFLTFSQSLS